MAKPRKLWSALKPATQKRKLSYYGKQGLSPAQVRSRYNSGSLGSQTASRGHAKTPERPSRARKNPERYREYLDKRRFRDGPGPSLTLRDRAYNNFFRHLGGYLKYNDDTVRHHIYNMMNDGEVAWTINASEEDLLHYASVAMHQRYFGNYLQSPWWYH
jgi:hypothetical protein